MKTVSPGLYVHLPFCSHLCPYCDFAVLVGQEERRGPYLASLVEEAALWAETELFSGFDTVYLGGGTPSLHTREELARLLADLEGVLGLEDGWRLFLEANPEDVTRETVRAWRSLGVDFLSLGVQSFDDERLGRLGRRHDASGARRAVELAMGEGFETVSVDLIYGLPGLGSPPPEEREAWLEELETAVSYEVQHLSCYQLTVHEGTRFGHLLARGRLQEAADEDQGELFLVTHERLGELGLPAYEVSNFSRGDAHRSRHNRKYWRHVPYLGLGLAAHSHHGRRRWWNLRGLRGRSTALEVGRRPVEDEEVLTEEQLALEAILLGLRTVEGVDVEAYRRRFGVDPVAANASRIGELAAAGLLEGGEDLLRATPRGLAVVEGLARELETGLGG